MHIPMMNRKKKKICFFYEKIWTYQNIFVFLPQRYNRHYTFKDDKENEVSYWHSYTYEEGSSPFEFSLSGEVKYESTDMKLVYWDEL